jgi:ATP phosphoribosyltransferase regulatory subunit
MGHRPRPLRLAYGGPILKLRATQLRPERELTQAGAELIGTDSLAAVIEVLQVAIEALEVAGVTGITVDLTLPNLVETLAADAMPLPAEKIDAVRDMLDAKDAGGLTGLGADAYLPFIEAAGPVGPALAKLRAITGAQALDKRLEAIEAIVAAVGDRVTLTLDPTERHGFEYQSWLGFSIFAGGVLGEIGRGGTYTIVHENGAEEAAVGFSLYADAIVAAGLAEVDRRRLFVPLGTDPAVAAMMRAAGWVTVAALEAGDTPEAQLCTHLLAKGEARAL